MAGRRSPWGAGNDSGQPEPASHAPEADAPSGEPGDESEVPPKAPAKAPEGPRNPWHSPTDGPPRRSASIEDIFRSKGPRRGGGSGGGGGGFPRLPERPDGKSWAPAILGAVLLGWAALTCTHMLGPKEKGIVTTLGKYSRTINSGVSLTLPWPIESVAVHDVTSYKLETIPDGEGEKLMLTSDQNLVDLSYLVRWNIKDLQLYTFQLEEPETTVREVAEAAMRASLAEVSLTDALGGSGRARIELAVLSRMQSVLDAYHSGIQVQGVAIQKADPPEKVKGAFQQVTAAQQDAQRDQSNARAWAQQLMARAQGDAALFDKIYAQYQLAPEVTKRRLYYETMERVLANNDKVVVDGNGVVPYLPLPEMKRKDPAMQTVQGGR